TDSKGRTVSFKNAVVILTSNVGAAEAEHAVSYGFGGELAADRRAATGEKEYEEMKARITEALKERFRPEFLNRLDDIIVFHRLSESDAAKIGGKLVNALGKRLSEQRGITLSVTDAALSQLVKEGYDSRYGARPLKRTVQRRIEDRLSEEILLGNVENGRHVTVDFADGEYTFTAR
ncbi:MAG TPA: AAA family ATPase, partial [Candidatus Scatosoma pullistercoris]|nr:AAA family ATPase [Candidatus Scatosoma pullistercoris]